MNPAEEKLTELEEMFIPSLAFEKSHLVSYGSIETMKRSRKRA